MNWPVSMNNVFTDAHDHWAMVNILFMNTRSWIIREHFVHEQNTFMNTVFMNP